VQNTAVLEKNIWKFQKKLSHEFPWGVPNKHTQAEFCLGMQVITKTTVHDI